MWTLASFPSEIIGGILEYLTLNDVLHLLACGNTVLGAKVSLKAQNFDVAAFDNFKFPFAAFNLPCLRSIRVASSETLRVILLLPETRLKHIGSRDSLETLEFDFAQCGSLLHETSAPLSSLYPSLTSLKLRSVHAKAEILVRLADLPPNLKVFELVTSTSNREANFPLSLVSKLPRTLTQLNISWQLITDAEEEHFQDPEAFWPPQLRVLALSFLHSHKILDMLPKTLEDMTIRVHRGFSAMVQNQTYHLRPSTLPPGITSLRIDDSLAHWDLKDPNERLPPRLTFLNGELPLPDPLAHLPKSITAYPFHLLSQYSIKEIFTALPNLKSAPIQHHDMSESGGRTMASLEGLLPPNMTSLTMFRHTEQNLTLTLPPKLTKLAIVTLKPSEVTKLPPGLKTLLFQPHSRYKINKAHLDYINNPPGDKSDLEFANENFLWNASDLSRLPSHLVKLTLQMTHIWQYSDLSGLKQLVSLRNLDLADISAVFPKDGFTASKCLPNSLESLALSALGSCDLEEDEPNSFIVSDPVWLLDFFESNGKEDILPNLIYLQLNFNIIDRNAIAGRIFSKFPKNLTSLELRYDPPAIVEENDAFVLGHLPRSLRTLVIYMNDLNGNEEEREDLKWTDAHLADQLPPLLANLCIEVSSNCTLTPSVLDRLPPHLYFIEFLSSSSLELVKAAEDRVKNAPQTKDYFAPKKHTPARFGARK